MLDVPAYKVQKLLKLQCTLHAGETADVEAITVLYCFAKEWHQIRRDRLLYSLTYLTLKVLLKTYTRKIA